MSTVMRIARRRTRPMVIAGVTAFFILAGGGTALAVAASHTGNAGLHDRPMSATSHPAKDCSPSDSPSPVPVGASPVPVASRAGGGSGASATSPPPPTTRSANQ
jgi:hypothetical protein